MNQNSCFITAKSSWYHSKILKSRSFSAFIVPPVWLMFSFSSCSKNNSLYRTVKQAAADLDIPCWRNSGHSDFGIFLNCFQDMVFKVIQQKILPLNRDKHFIQGAKTNKLKETFLMDSIGNWSKIKLTVVIVFSHFYFSFFQWNPTFFLPATEMFLTRQMNQSR